MSPRRAAASARNPSYLSCSLSLHFRVRAKIEQSGINTVVKDTDLNCSEGRAQELALRLARRLLIHPFEFETVR